MGKYGTRGGGYVRGFAGGYYRSGRSALNRSNRSLAANRYIARGGGPISSAASRDITGPAPQTIRGLLRNGTMYRARAARSNAQARVYRQKIHDRNHRDIQRVMAKAGIRNYEIKMPSTTRNIINVTGTAALGVGGIALANYAINKQNPYLGRKLKESRRRGYNRVKRRVGRKPSRPASKSQLKNGKQGKKPSWARRHIRVRRDAKGRFAGSY